MKKRYVVLGVLAGLAGLLVVGGIAAAQTGGDSAATPTPSPFVQELAERLNLDAATVQSAVEQAKQTVLHDKMNEIVSKRLEKAVEAGRLTQAEADSIKTWWESRPVAADKAIGGFMAGHGPKMGRHGPGAGAHHHGPQAMPMAPQAMPMIPQGSTSS